MRGILLAGGHGSRLWPATAAISKQLLPVAGRPLCYFPLVTLMEAGIREICIITMPKEAERFHGLLGTGEKWDLDICYAEQAEPRGLAEAFIIGEDFIGSDPVALILGDNLFLGVREAVAPWATPDKESVLPGRSYKGYYGGAVAFTTLVAHPERYGVIGLDKHRRWASIREKPTRPRSNEVITGLYLCSPCVVEIAKALKPSKRGELEITGVLSGFMRRGQLHPVKLPPSAVWMDGGTASDLHEASALVFACEKRTGDVLGSPELTAFRQGFISAEQFKALVEAMPKCFYREQLETLCLRNKKQNRASSQKR